MVDRFYFGPSPTEKDYAFKLKKKRKEGREEGREEGRKRKHLS